MTLQDCYSRLSGNYEDVMSRLFKEERVSKFLLRFLDDETFGMLCSSYAVKDWETAFRAAHTLKGSCANLGLSAMGSAASELTEALRSGTPAPNSDELLEKVKAAASQTLDTIRAYKAELDA